MSSKKIELTKDSITKAIESGAASLTQLWKALGGKGSVGGGTARRMRELVPEVDDLMIANKPTGRAQAGAVARKASDPKEDRAEYPRAPMNPFREGSAYGVGFDILHATREKGIARDRLVAEMGRLTKKSLKKAYFDATVVVSSRKDGNSHKCISKAADIYFVERTEGGWLKLVLRDRKF